MAQTIRRHFSVVRFKRLPRSDMFEYQCVPSKWIKCDNDEGQVAVAYPEDIPLDMDNWIRTRRDPLLKWPLFPAISVIEIDSYAQWSIVMAILLNHPSIDVWQLRTLLGQNDDGNEHSKNLPVTEPEVVLSEMKTPVLANSLSFWQDPPQPSTSSQIQNATPLLERRRTENFRQSNGSAGTNGSQRLSLDFNSSHEEVSNIQNIIPRKSNVSLGNKRTSQTFNSNQGNETQQNNPKNRKISTPMNPTLAPKSKTKASTSVSSTENPVVIQLKQIYEQMNELLEKILAIVRNMEN